MRLGLIVPSTNTVAEQDFNRAVPGGVSVHTARMYIDETTAAAERRMVEEHLPTAARDLATARPDVVVFSCTSAGAVLGHDGDGALVDRLATTIGCSVVSTNAAVHDALEAVGASQVAVLTAYIEALTDAIREGIERVGMTVPVAAGMDIVDPFAIAEVEPGEIITFAERRLAGSTFDTIFVSCTNLRALEARPLLAERFGVPVVTSNQAALDKAVSLLEGVGTMASKVRDGEQILADRTR